MNFSRKTTVLRSAAILLVVCLTSGCASPRAYHKVKPGLPAPAAGQERVFVCLQRGSMPYRMDIVIGQNSTRHAGSGEFLYVDLSLGEHQVSFLNEAAQTPTCSQTFQLVAGHPVVVELLCSGGEQLADERASVPRYSGGRPLPAQTAYSVATTPLQWSCHIVPPEQAEKVLSHYVLEPAAWECLDATKFSSLPEEAAQKATGSK